MSYQNISYVMSQADFEAIKTYIAKINNMMQFLITLDSKEKRSIIKLGPKSVDFMEEAILVVTTHPHIFPSAFNTAEFIRDTTLFKQLTEMMVLVDSLSEKLNDTYIAIGNEVMTASLEVYDYLRTAKERTPGLNSAYDKMGARFTSRPRKKPDNPSNPG